MGVERDEEADNTIAQDVAAAAEEMAKAAPEPKEAPAVEAKPEVAEKPTEEKPRDDGRESNGRFKAKEEAKAEKPVEAKPTEAAKPVPAPVVGTPVAPVVPTAEVKPPLEAKAFAAFTPAEREHLIKAPREVQEAALRLQREVQKTLNDTAPVRKRWDAIEGVAKPYEAMFKTRGQSPEQAFESYVRTDAILSTGTVEQKAHVIATLLKSYGLSGQGELDRITHYLGNEGGAPVPFAQPQQPQRFDPASIKEELRREMAEERQAQEINAWLDANEFARDVEHEIAAVITAHRASGKQTTKEQAYELVMRAHEADEASEIGQIRRQRKEAEKAAKAAAAAEPAKRAAVSVKSSPVVSTPTKKKNGSVADDMAEALAEIANR